MKRLVITGGSGFIGSNVARKLKDRGDFHICVVDVAPLPGPEADFCDTYIHGDLRDQRICRGAVQNAHTVLHFAANMGGMGAIHEQNDTILYNDNHTMSMNVIQASKEAGVSRFFYASSACVYPEERQNDAHSDVSLRETDAYPPGVPTRTQGCYGLEKFNTENLLLNLSGEMVVRIARFHNVYGPGGAWNNGREKAPAALLRKACALHLRNDADMNFEIWGDGSQRRSFLYIDDAVDAVLKLLDAPSDIKGPLNIGSNTSVTIQYLAETALHCAGIPPSRVTFLYNPSRPVGVASRNSNNHLVHTSIQWTPTTALEEGMRKTFGWIKQQVLGYANGSACKDTTLSGMALSLQLDLRPKPICYGILLPVTSFGGSAREDCLANLSEFARSLNNTTRADTQMGYDNCLFTFKIYLAVDKVDDFLMPNSVNKLSRAEKVLQTHHIYDVQLLVCDYPPGHVCSHWRECARRAYDDSCDYMVLLGDDVVLLDEGWMHKAHSAFERLASEHSVPKGFGCVAFTDISFPGMPTFPIISRTHMNIFGGTVVPDLFINQDGDPFLFQLYRRWGCSTMMSCRVSNGIGGELEARYAKASATNWTFEPLTDAASSAQCWLANNDYPVHQNLTLDIIIPCYRVDIPIIDRILSLRPSTTCSVMFIIIIDDPQSPFIQPLMTKYSHRPDIRIRVNRRNLGASASRNRGMKESAADWIHFLDDDVVPEEDLLVQDEKVIRAHPLAAGFVGTTLFPVADTIFTTAVHLAGVTYFWDIAANKLDSQQDVPWGVTANLIARRSIPDMVEFNLIYPKTGGGEDIHFCREKRQASLQRGSDGFWAAPDVRATHPWWNGGNRTYWRFYNWSVGDGALIRQFPQHAYFDFAPNSAECLALCFVAALIFGVLGKMGWLAWSMKAFVAVFMSNVIHDLYRHLLRHPERTRSLNTSLRCRQYAMHWILAIVESSFIRIFSECGRLRGIIARGEYASMGKRFDWFTGRCGLGPRDEERANSVQRVVVFLVLMGIAH